MTAQALGPAEYARTTDLAPPPAEMGRITPRELEVWRLVAAGLNNAEVARALFVSMPTVKTHVARLLHKTGSRDRVQLVVLAYAQGIAIPPRVGMDLIPARLPRPRGRRTP